MDIFNVNSIVLKNLSSILDNNYYKEDYVEEKVDRVRIVEKALVVTEEIERNRVAVTAHQLEEYMFADYRLVMDKQIDTWLYKLLLVQESV